MDKNNNNELISDKEAIKILNKIMNMYPDARGELNWDTVFHLLCAVLMSAQTTDKMVNSVTPKFNQDYPDSRTLAIADVKDIEDHIKTIGLFRTKSKHLKETAQIITEKYNGHVPKSRNELIKLPGVGRKTANVVLAEAYNIPAIAVDTHVSRISKNFKIVSQNATPLEIELHLEKLLPKENWIRAHHAMIMFGRYTMPARAKNKDPYIYLE